MLNTTDDLSSFDPDVWQAIKNEGLRQEEQIELIASENYVSPQVLEAQGCVMTNKYAEGYPGRRYYGGCEHVDAVESLAIQRAKDLFEADFANVQPHSGSQANSAAYLALLNPGDTILGMSLSDGGHLTHGSPVSSSGKLYNAIQYGVDANSGLLDYDHLRDLAKQHQPKLIVAGFSAYSRVLDWSQFREIADEVGSHLLVDMAHVAGLVAAGLYPNPVTHADVTTSTTHKTMAGPRGGLILARRNKDLQKQLNSALFPGTQGGPLMHIVAAKAVCFKEAMSASFRSYQQQVLSNARTMAREFQNRGYDIVSNGTDCHLMLVDLRNRGITGKAADEALHQANITVNRNTVPNDPRSAFVTSGLRIGSPAITRRGFGEDECSTIVGWACDILDDIKNDNMIHSVKLKVLELCRQFPVYA